MTQRPRRGTETLLVAAMAAISVAGCKNRQPQVKTDAIADTARVAPPRTFPSCPRFSAGRRTGSVANETLAEASGLVASRNNPGVLWSHNDSGGHGRVYAMSEDGRDLGVYVLEDTGTTDWEDIALGPGQRPSQSYLYIGDIGANKASRSRIAVYRVLEPKVNVRQRAPMRHKLLPHDVLWLRYPDSVSRDAETLMIDPKTSDLYVVTKVVLGSPHVYRARAPLRAGRVIELTHVSSLDLTSATGLSLGLVTGGDISADGQWVVIRTYTDAFVWRRPRGHDVGEILRTTPCRIPLVAEPQGEAIAWAPDSGGYFTLSEGNKPPIYYFERLPHGSPE
jgi:hypothetical protein